MVKSILQYLCVTHSPNLHHLFILTCSTDATWCFVSLTYILCLSDHGKEEIFISSLYYINYKFGATFTKLASNVHLYMVY